MTEAAAKLDAEITLTSLVLKALDELDGDAGRVVDRLYSQIRADPKLLRSILHAALHSVIYNRTQKAINHKRESIIYHLTEQRERVASRANVIALADGIKACLLDFPLAGGKKLRDATSEDIWAQVYRYEKLAGDLSHKARWLRLIANRTPKGKCVGDALKEEKVKELFEKARTAPADGAA